MTAARGAPRGMAEFALPHRPRRALRTWYARRFPTPMPVLDRLALCAAVVALVLIRSFV
ncbi:hypothetical protein [Yinghuangia seranimata]|uniref:hypothetical protein n=1 Tax=Yinghuangia seranimata TaxID=408067 RepID=UPI00248D1C30|nr:hypothetical protein [Yinghuangia seranimata]MDI2125185.1 hypothetical protein [Yinghuangia seranimata]